MRTFIHDDYLWWFYYIYLHPNLMLKRRPQANSFSIKSQYISVIHIKPMWSTSVRGHDIMGYHCHQHATCWVTTLWHVWVIHWRGSVHTCSGWVTTKTGLYLFRWHSAWSGHPSWNESWLQGKYKRFCTFFRLSTIYVNRLCVNTHKS